MTEVNLFDTEITPPVLSDTDTNNINASIKTPGAILREARKAKNLSEADVAKRIHLNEYQVKAIEEDDYSQISALIYVRGYLRCFAICVDISPDEVIAAFDALSFSEKFEQMKEKQGRLVMHQMAPSVISRATRVINIKAIRWVSIGALFFLVVFVGVWWKDKKHIIDQLQAVVLQSEENLPLAPVPIAPIVTMKDSAASSPSDSGEGGVMPVNEKSK